MFWFKTLTNGTLGLGHTHTFSHEKVFHFNPWDPLETPGGPQGSPEPPVENSVLGSVGWGTSCFSHVTGCRRTQTCELWPFQLHRAVSLITRPPWHLFMDCPAVYCLSDCLEPLLLLSPNKARGKDGSKAPSRAPVVWTGEEMSVWRWNPDQMVPPVADQVAGKQLTSWQIRDMSQQCMHVWPGPLNN